MALPRYGLPGTPLATAAGGRLELPPARQVHRNPAARRATHGRKPWLRSCSIPLPWKHPCGRCGPWSLSKCGARRKSRSSTTSSPSIIPSATRGRWGTRQISGLGWGRVIACLAWSSAPRHLGARDRFIAGRQRRGAAISVFSPTILAISFCLGFASAFGVARSWSDARRIAADWERIYGHPLYFLETFVDPERYRGTCYRAANWVVMGRTTGRGKNCPNKRPNRSIKEVLGYPLTPRFRELLAKVE